MSRLRDLIVLTVEHYYNKNNLQLNPQSEGSLSEFIHHPHSLLLQGLILDDNTLNLYTKIQYEKQKSIVFYKSAPLELTAEDAFNSVNFVTLSNNAAESLYHILKQIYSPLLANSNDLLSNKLQKNISDLESNLRIITHGSGDGNSSVILSVEDEVEYWRTVAEKRDITKKDSESASAFCELFEDIAEELRSMQSTTLSEIREATENIGGLLDDVWRLTPFLFSQDRMIQIFDIIGHVICSTIQRAFPTSDLWKVSGGSKEIETLTLLSDSLKVIQTWISACQTLTDTYWPNYALHAWNGKSYIPLFCVNFENRLKEIYEIKSTYSQLNKLLTNSEREELKTHQLFESFENIDVWICNGSNQAWDTAMSRFSSNLCPTETKIAEKLKPRLHNTSTKQMLYEFMRYKALLDRPLVKHALNNELEIFVSSLVSMVKTIKDQLESDDIDVNMYQPPEMTLVVQQIQWAKQTEAKVKDIHTCAVKYLTEFEGSSELLKLTDQVLKDLKSMYMQLYEEWTRDLQAQVQNGSLLLSTDEPVVDFSSATRLMVVRYDARAQRLSREARALRALQLPAPPPQLAAPLHRLGEASAHALTLHQVASFHNTLGERMIPSTRPMMLQAALDLSNLVRDHKAVYWSDTEQLTKYTEELKKIVLKLESQNTYLTNQHVAIRNIVEKLMDTELLAQQSEWKKKIKEMRDIIEKVEANGYKNTESWRTHWDWQLYKALECQYMKTLLSLHKHFPNVRVDLVLRGRSVRVAPPMEEVRAQHYHQLRRLASLPAQFVGLQPPPAADQENIFAAIVHKHSWLGNKAVQQLEAALSALERARAEWSRRAALACVPDLDALCTQHLKEPADWENNFKACKAYGQAVAKMSFEDEKIEWISVGTASLRREFEAQARNLWSCLMSSLQSSCRADAASVDAFVAGAALAMQNNTMPKNAKELAEISAKQQALRNNMPEMEKTVENLKRKSHMVRTWGGDASADGTIKEWQKIREHMASQQQMFEHQAEIVKSSLNGEWENLNTTVEAWLSRWNQNKSRFEETHGVNYTEMADRCRLVFEAQAQWEAFVADRDELKKECEKFNLKLEISEIWKDAEKLMKEYASIWGVFKDYDNEFVAVMEQEWIVFQKKLHLLEEFVSKWIGQMEPYTVVTLYLQQELDKYSDLTTLLKYLRGSDFTERHWREVFSLLEMENKKPEELKVKDFLGAASNIKKQIKSLQKISTAASSEAAVRSALSELELWFAGARLSVMYYSDKAKRPTPIVKDFKDVLTKIEEQQWVVSSVSGGAGGAGGAGGDACAAWESRLRAARALLRAAHHAQRRWLYLEPILSNDDGELGAKFRKVDQGFRQVTRVLEGDPRLSVLLQSTRLQPMLDSISEQLHTCQSALNKYIDEKRSIFPRLYFLSDDDLLELLGQARAGAEGRGAVMQTHLKKLFPGITAVRLGPGDMSITALCSQYDEILQLDHPVDIDCPVEVWLKNLESEMRSSLQSMTLKCVVTSSLKDQDPFTLPAQILCLSQNVRFTEQAERAITAKELHKLKAVIEKENSSYASAEIEDESERFKRQALILQCTHYMLVIQTLIDNNVVSTSDWLWQKQLRFYLLNTKEIVAKMGLAQISYSYEYLGVNTGQFVRTELADECFLILTQSLHLGLVGNPFGPAGTGKTESVKALGGLVGRLVLVFNCDEALDAEAMGRLLTGLALCGAWGCFDEFNRLSAATLAAVSHQLASLLPAMKSSARNTERIATLNGKQISVSPWCGVAATMNPSGRGYGGRRALPAALERALRPVAMLAPRAQPLAASLLAARAVRHAEALANDLHDVFTLASHLLSNQRHYDWGLRALKAAVGSCGAALAGRGQDELRAQRQVARRVLALNNVSKLTAHDADRFENILSLVFADVPKEEHIADPVSKALETTFENLHLIYNKSQIQKCTELYEQLQQRMGVAIVGPPCSGKTTIRRLLKSALTSQGKNIVEYVICPKAMSRNCLLGNIDHDTRQWTDGVISAAALEISNQPSDVWSWVVCDGDVDPEWVEALNSVLDDNRLLTLPSGWRVQLGHNVNFVFETHGLQHASPATISRLGIILLSDVNNCAQEVLENWIKKLDPENETVRVAVPLLQHAVGRSIKWFNDNRSNVLSKTYDFSVVKHIITQFEYIVQNVGSNMPHSAPEEMVYMAIQRSVIGLIKENSVDSFHRELSDILGPPPAPLVIAGEWVSDTLFMSARLAACEPAVRACVLSDNEHLLLVGPDASGKSALIDYVLKETNFTVITIDCTPILEPADIVAELKRNNAVRSGGGYDGGSGGGGGARVALVVRALHRAAVDSWGCSAVHQFLLQLIQHGGFWSSSGSSAEEGGPAWSRVSRVCVLATAAAEVRDPRLAAARPQLTLSGSDARLLSSSGSSAEEGGPAWSRTARVCVLATAAAEVRDPRLAAARPQLTLSEPDDEELLELSTHYLRQNLDKNVSEKDLTKVAADMLAMYKEVTETFYSHPHYKWNADHLKQWCENVKWYSPTNSTELMMAVQAEANVIFRDRLITDDEKGRMNAISRNYLKTNANDNIYFAPKVKGDGIYLEAVENNDWYQRMQKLINQCLSENENVFGDSGAEACSELATLCSYMTRASRGGPGLAVLVGSAGAGRRAALQLAAALLPAAPVLVGTDQHFYSLMRQALNSAAEGTRTLVLISESACGPSQLSACEALFAADSAHAIPSLMVPPQTEQNLLDNIKKNLGVVICLDKDQENIWEILEKFPLLYSVGQMIWMDHWSHETLRRLPTLIVERLVKESLTETSKEELQSMPTDGFVQIYSSLEARLSRAPSRYVCFIKTYFYIVNKKKDALTKRQKMLSAGVEALRRARSEVATLQAEANVQQQALTEKQESANRALEQIAVTVRANTDQRDEMTALKNNIEKENDKLQIRKKEIEEELASVEPIIAAARSAVGDIRPESLSEIRSLRAPPDVVRDVLEGVLRLMGIADTSWHSMKNFLSKRGVKEDIRCLDASQITAEAVESVEKLLKSRGSSFEPSVAKRASAACAPLAAWVRANLAYAGALARVRPLQLHQAQLHKNLRAAEEQLEALSSGLATVDERVAALQQQLGLHTRDAAVLELRLASARQTIGAATALIDTVAAEYRAWEALLESISKEIVDLNSRSLLSAAYLVYLPDLTEQQAREHLKKWSALIGFEDESFSVLNFLSTAETQLRWEADGLPSDTSAVKNAVLIDQALQSHRCGLIPLVIDPDGEAMTWLQNTLADKQCDFVSQHSDKLITAVQYAVRLGRTLVITDVDSVHPSWESLLHGAAGSPRLVLVSRSAELRARLAPQHAARLAQVPFTARREALTDQLVYYALQRLNPEVNEKSKEIKLKKATLQKQQYELQENLLRDLSSNSDILNDANLVASLKKTRESSATIAEALAAAQAIAASTGEACARYGASAARAASLALAVKRLAVQRPLLALPIDVVLDVYVDALRRGDINNIDDNDVIKYITRRIIGRVLLGLHKKDKYIVILHILKQVYSDAVPDKLWQLFLGNVISIDDQRSFDEIKKTYPWIPDDQIKKVAQLKVIDEVLFKKLSLGSADLWKEFINSGDLNLLSRLQLSAFETAVAVSALRPDSVYRAVVACADQLLGAGWADAEAVSAACRWAGGRGAGAGGRAPRPALVLAAHAADVLAAHARARKCDLVQVGISEGPPAWEAALERCRGGGGWLALAVGASPFPAELLALLASLARRPVEDFNEDFRLWIVTEDREIPALIANACVNVILEAPEGVKHNVVSTLSAWGNYEAEPALVRVHACLALFHAVVQERRAYIPQGWSQWYAWEWGEVCACASAIRAGGASATALVLALYAARLCASPDRRALAALHRATLAAPAAGPRGLPLRLPDTRRLQAYSTAFEELPQIDSPELLGLPANCRIAWERNAANDIISGLKEIDSVATHQENKNNVTPLKMILALWKKLMSGSPLLKEDYDVKKVCVGWWGAAAACEARAAAACARALHLALSARARASARAAPLHKVPEEWQSVWAGPDSPEAYVREFCARALAAHSRGQQDYSEDYLPKEVDLRSWLAPARAVWALRALASRRLRRAPHALALHAKWGGAGGEGDSDAGPGLSITGLWLSGAVWDARGLAAAPAHAPPHAPAPPITLRYLPQGGTPLSPEGTAEICVYSSALRERSVCSLRAPLAPGFARAAAALHAAALLVAPNT